MDSYIIQINPKDELTAIIDKIINTQAQRVYLLIPENSRIAENVLSLRLLKRESDTLKKEIIVVSKSQRVQAVALKASLQVHQETERLRSEAKAQSGGKNEGKASFLLRDIAAPSAEEMGSSCALRKEEEKPEAEKTALSKKEKKTELDKEKINYYSPNGADEIDGKGSRGASLRKFLSKMKVPGAILPTPPRAISSPVHWANFWRIRNVKYWLMFFAAGGVIAGGLVLYSGLSKAKIYITSAVEGVNLSLKMRSDINVSEIKTETLVVPGQIFEKSLERSKSVITSKEKEINEKARGTIRVFNAFSSAPQTLVETTRFMSEDGKLFRTTKTIVVPGAEVEGGKIIPSSIEAEVVAAEAGEEYNIGPSSFSIPGFKGTAKYLAFYGESSNSMEGGRIAKVKVVSKEEYDNAKKELEEELKRSVLGEIAMELRGGFFIPPDAQAISEVSINSSKQVGEEAEQFVMSGKISLQAFSIRKNDVIELLTKDFEKKFAGKRLIEKEGDDVEFDILSPDFSIGIMDMTASYSTSAAARIDGEDIKNGIIGKEEGSVRAFLSSYPGIKEAKVTFWPFWVNKISLDLSRIEIIISP